MMVLAAALRSNFKLKKKDLNGALPESRCLTLITTVHCFGEVCEF